MGWPSERSKREWAEEEEMLQALKKTKTIKPEYKLAQAQQPNIDEILKALLLEALNHTHFAATPQETFNMFYGSDSYREYKQTILALLAQEVNKAMLIKPGEIIPYIDHKGKQYVELKWLTDRLERLG